MNKFVTSALALTAASGLSFAGPGSEEWAGLDRDIENLASSFAPQGGGFAVDGFLISSYDNSSDIMVGSNDLGGFTVRNARANLQGSVGDYGVFISFDAGADPTGFGPLIGGLLGTYSFGTGAANLLDAYGTFSIGDQVNGQVGQFRPPFLWSSQLNEDKFVLLNRSINGAIWASRDTGVMFNGTFEQVGWYVSAQNGSDSVGDELAFTGRVDFDALGTGAGMQEGAYGASDESSLTVGVAFHDDGDLNDGTAIGGDAVYTIGAFSAAAEIVDYDQDYFGTDMTPFSVTASYMVSPDEYEIAVRFEDLDDSDDTTIITGGVNRYVAGHDAKWGINYTTVNSDDSSIEVDIISVGLTVSV